MIYIKERYRKDGINMWQMISQWKADDQSKVLSSDIFQSSKLPSGKYLRMMNGIFFSVSYF